MKHVELSRVAAGYLEIVAIRWDRRKFASEGLIGSAPTLQVSRPAQRSLALRPARSLTPYRSLLLKCFSRVRYLPKPLQVLPVGATNDGAGFAPARTKHDFHRTQSLIAIWRFGVFGCRLVFCCSRSEISIVSFRIAPGTINQLMMMAGFKCVGCTVECPIVVCITNFLPLILWHAGEKRAAWFTPTTSIPQVAALYSSENVRAWVGFVQGTKSRFELPSIEAVAAMIQVICSRHNYECDCSDGNQGVA